jgi:hypothetical protein
MGTNKCYSGIKIPENEYINNDDDVAAPTGEFMQDIDQNETSRIMPSFYSQNLFPYALLYKKIDYTEAE